MTDSDSLLAEPAGSGPAVAAETEASGPAIFDGATSPIAALIVCGQERGHVTRTELDRALPPGRAGADLMEDAMTTLSELGIAVIENGDAEGSTDTGRPVAEMSAAAAVTGEEDHGRTDDPMALYLRDMGRRALLDREGEAAIAQRIEAGREAVLDGLCEHLPAMRAVSAWRNAIHEGSLALRDVIDVEATYGADGQQCDGNLDEAKTAKLRRRRGRHRGRQAPPLRDEGCDTATHHGGPRRDGAGLPEAPSAAGAADRVGPEKADADGIAVPARARSGAQFCGVDAEPPPERCPHRDAGGRIEGGWRSPAAVRGRTPATGPR